MRKCNYNNANSDFYIKLKCIQLQDVKSTDSKTTLVNYLVKTVQKHYPELMKLEEDLQTLEKAKRSKNLLVYILYLA